MTAMLYRPRSRTILGAAALATLLISGCEGGNNAQDRVAVAVSPVANPPAATSGARVARAPATVTRDEWVDDRRGAGASSEALVAAGPAVVPVGSMAQDEEEAAQKAAREARQRTERAVDETLRASFGKLQACYRKVRRRTSKTTLKFRVHRSGYVASPEVETGDSGLDSCIKGVLNNLRVSGVETDSLTLERTVQFTVGGR